MAQSEESGLLPRLVIEEITPPIVRTSGGDIRLLSTAESPSGLFGDQVRASIASSVSGSTANGFLVWHDNAIDGDGTGIGFRLLNLGTGVAAPSIVQLNQNSVANQENPKVAALSGGGAIVVWQSGVSGKQSIVGRFVGRTGVASGNEFVIAASRDGLGHSRPSVASLPDGGFVVVWEALGRDQVSRKISVARYNSEGLVVGPVRVLGTSADVDRAPAVTAHSNGKIVVAWIAEQATPDVLALGGQSTRLDVNADVFAQVIYPDGSIGSPIWVNVNSAPCDSPALAALPNGKTVIGWSEYDLAVETSWDIKYVLLSPQNVALSSPTTLNTYRPYEQNYLSFAVNTNNVAVGGAGSDCLAVWASRGADGSGLGIAGRSLNLDGVPQGDEIVFNGAKLTDQMEPSVAATRSGYRVVWSGLTGVTTGIDLAGRNIEKIARTGNRTLKISWRAVLNERYRLESSSDLLNWQTYKDFGAASSQQQSTTVSTSDSANIYFRVKLDR